MLQFICNELVTGMTYVSLAHNSQTDEKRLRNQQNSRKAYDTAQRFFEQHVARKGTKRPDLRDGLTKLRNLLIELGEKFEE